ncbi:hypothetical protein NBO_370g0004 [Nosema bombycis CQ1]|uniref:Uncharacterized protein n=1 Tax=Nosema bombycis (strain CQ1 / CVCC 102059) TaxID=578461 RepID=R0MIY3_NOSB1|nr:hypothetical protein NBO_370g0004 [Nosema bombycis CQ1]|eukprot:EOB12758.1 hypothetical protein NBO_370g0004 [Nosema bombycis CQ1]
MTRSSRIDCGSITLPPKLFWLSLEYFDGLRRQEGSSDHFLNKLKNIWGLFVIILKIKIDIVYQ